MSKSVPSPHDRFIKSMMANPKVVKEFFETNLPLFVKESADLSTITLQKESFIDDSLRLQMADMLFEVQFNKKDKGYFYCLLEHQSTSQKILPFRILKYMVSIQEHHMEKHKTQRLPLVVPLVLYTGKKPYTHSMDLFDLFESQKELAQKMWMQPYPLLDLTQVPDEELKQYQWFGTMALIAKHIRDRDMLPFLKELVQILKSIEVLGEERYIIKSLSYIIGAGQVSNPQDFIEIVTKGLESIDEEKAMKIADLLKEDVFNRGIQKGILEGEKRGILEGKKETALALLEQGQDIGFISKVTGLTKDFLLQIKTGTKKVTH